jgi:LacI family transcriptional regulator
MRDIADALRLSKTTVSWILSGKGEEKKFSTATIKRVTDYTKKINYQPNLLARSLSLGTTNTIGLIIPFIDDTFYAQLAQSIEVEAEKRNYLLTVCSSDGNSHHEIDLIRILRSKRMDGLIIAPTKNSVQEIKRLKQDNFPFILVDRYFPEIDTNYIVVNNEDSSCQLINTLIKKGCKKIALLTSDVHLLVMGFRLKGYKKALKKAKIVCNPELILQIQRNDYKKDIITQLDTLFRKHQDIDGFYFTTHYLAIEAIRYFLSRGINYNKRFKMACFHETEALDILAPKMIVARMPVNDIGKKAMDILQDNITDKTMSPKNMMLTNEIVKL